MNCVEVDLRLQGFFDRELPIRERDAVHRHLNGCASCRFAMQGLSMEIADLLVDISEPRASLRELKNRVEGEIHRRKPLHPLPLAPLTVSIVLLASFSLALISFRSERPASPTSVQAVPAGSSEKAVPVPAASETKSPEKPAEPFPK